jgi:hypothetical protein
LVRHIDEVTAALRGVRMQATSARLAVGAAPGLPSHVWARTLLSAQAAGFDRLAILGVNQDGEPRGVDLEAVSPLKGQRRRHARAERDGSVAPPNQPLTVVVP